MTTELSRTELAAKIDRETDASPLYAAFVASPHPNRIRTKATRWHERELSDEYLRGGGFVTAVWDGDLKKAFTHADLQNLDILEDVTGMDKEAFLGWQS